MPSIIVQLPGQCESTKNLNSKMTKMTLICDLTFQHTYSLHFCQQ